MKLYYHKTDGGAEYLTDKFILCEGGHKEGIFKGANFIVRLDGDIEKDAELTVSNEVTNPLERIAGYMQESEQKHFEESDKPKDHIYNDVKRLAKFLKIATK